MQRRAHLVAALLALASLAVATTAPAQEPAPAGPLGDPYVGVELVVYHLAPPARPPLAPARALVKGAGFTLVDAVPKPGASFTKPLAIVKTPAVREAPPPPPDLVRVRNRLSAGDAKRLQHPAAVTHFFFLMPGAGGLAGYKAALGALRSFMRGCDCLVYDSETRWVLDAARLDGMVDSWQGDLPDVSKHVALDLYREGEMMRIVSLGMSKLGLPDLAIEQLSPTQVHTFANLANVILQTLVERGQLSRRGALDLSLRGLRHEGVRKHLLAELIGKGSGVASVQLVTSKPQEGDADNRQLALIQPGPPDQLAERQAQLAERFFGSKELVEQTREGDPELQAAARRARKALGALKPRFSPQTPEGAELAVKAPFRTTHDGIEWMWVQVLRWKGTKMEGILDNDPEDVPSLKAGARVTVDERELADYILRKIDGSVEGGESIKILQARQGAPAQ